MCTFPNCSRHAEKNGYCIGHQAFASFKQVNVPKKAEKKSDVRKEEEKLYKKIVRQMFAVSNLCELKIAGVCTKIAEGLHHQKKRGANYLNKKFLKRSCNACNNWCEKHPKEAMKVGASVSKFKSEVIVAEHDKQLNATIIQ